MKDGAMSFAKVLVLLPFSLQLLLPLFNLLKNPCLTSYLFHSTKPSISLSISLGVAFFFSPTHKLTQGSSCKEM
jgi:hypothetical protein